MNGWLAGWLAVRGCCYRIRDPNRGVKVDDGASNCTFMTLSSDSKRGSRISSIPPFSPLLVLACRSQRREK